MVACHSLSKCCAQTPQEVAEQDEPVNLKDGRICPLRRVIDQDGRTAAHAGPLGAQAVVEAAGRGDGSVARRSGIFVCSRSQQVTQFGLRRLDALIHKLLASRLDLGVVVGLPICKRVL